MTDDPTRERWRRVDEVFTRVADVPEAERADLLQRLCAGDARLHEEVSALLAADRAAGRFLERVRDGDRPLPDRPDAGRIGDYRLLRRIAEGGMGAVYLAARADELYQRRVAIKLIRTASDSEEARYRFQVERQILANLEHAYIARLYEAGVTSDGSPYLVLEWIDGVPIDAYCNQRRLSVRQRLELFCKVCEAVQFAHRSLLVHRDIKPDNVLVTEAGDPKLLDFGIAKPLVPEDFEQTVRRTATGMAPMTPRYASPEQVLGQPVTTASDVYSLGVLLNELLTGALPYRLTGFSAHELAQQICTAEPMSPSQTVAYLAAAGADERECPGLGEVAAQRRVKGGELKRRFKGDLDTIVLTALRKEPARRYSSVAQLAQDLRDHLADRPISARRDTLGYRTAKLIRRHPLALAAGTLALSAAAAFVVVLAVQSGRIAAEAEKSSQALAVLVDVFRGSDRLASGGREVSAREILDAAASRIGTEQQGSPEVQAILFDALGQVYLNLGLQDQAGELLRQARDRWDELGIGGVPRARTLTHLARLRLAQEDAAAARALAEQAVAELRAAGAPAIEQAGALNLLGATRFRLGDLDGAEAAHHAAREAVEPTAGENAETLSETYDALGAVALARTRYGIANSYYRQSLALLLERFGDRHPHYAASLARHAEVLAAQGAAAEAERLLRRALEVQRATLGEDHPDVHESILRLGRALEAAGRTGDAEDRYREALALARRGDRIVAVAASLRALGRLLSRGERVAEARRSLGAAVGLLEQSFGPEDARIAPALADLAEAELLVAEPSAAAATLGRLLNILEAQRTADLALLAETHEKLGQVRTMEGRYREAQEHFAAAARLGGD